MIARTYQLASEFLEKTQEALEGNEAANNLMLGICFQLKRLAEKNEPPPYRITAPPYLTTVEDERGLVVAAVMTPPHNIVVYGNRPDVREAFERVARKLFADRVPIPGVLGPSGAAQAFAQRWANVSGNEYQESVRQRVYELRQVVHSPAMSGILRLARESDVDLIARWILGFQGDTFTEGDLAEAHEQAQSRIKDQSIYLWDDEGPVSMAAKARPTTNEITVSLVYTPPELRKRGYATACVASLSQLLLDSGWKFCTLFTDLANPTSNHIYQKIGYVPVCDFNEYIFCTTA
jgi:predicted GNAT family acetyltransferase